MTDIKSKIDHLSSELKEHNYNYYVLARPVISDFDFDIKLKQLQKLEEEYPQFAHSDSPTKRVGGEISKEFKIILNIRRLNMLPENIQIYCRRINIA